MKAKRTNVRYNYIHFWGGLQMSSNLVVEYISSIVFENDTSFDNNDYNKDKFGTQTTSLTLQEFLSFLEEHLD